MRPDWLHPSARCETWWTAVDPRVKVLALWVVSALAVLLDSTGALSLLAVAVLLVAVSGLRLAWRGWLAVAGLVLLVAWTNTLTQGLFHPRDPSVQPWVIVPGWDSSWLPWDGLALEPAGVRHGLIQSQRFVAMSLLGVAVCLSTAPERLLAALVWFRVPRALAFAVLAALRFLPVVAEEAATTARARWLRSGGARPGGGWPARILAWLEAPRWVGPVLAAAVRRAATLALAVTARGFSAAVEPTPYPPWRPRLGERVAAACLVAVFVAAAALKTAAALSMAGWWTGPISEALCALVREWL